MSIVSSNGRAVWSARAVGVLTVAFLVAACGGARETQPASPAATTPPTAPTASAPPAPTRAGGCRADPLILNWGTKLRADLEIMMREGVAVVGYDCKRVRLIADCSASGTYGFVAEPKKTEAVQLDGGDLTMASSGRLSTSRERLPRSELRGECAGATHFVKRALVGAYRVEAAAGTSKSTTVGVLGGTVSASSASSASASQSDGDITKCDSPAGATAPPPQCGAVLRVELESIEGR
jgi:uncharacterized protein